jgi:hypothetical protein
MLAANPGQKNEVDLLIEHYSSLGPNRNVPDVLGTPNYAVSNSPETSLDRKKLSFLAAAMEIGARKRMIRVERAEQRLLFSRLDTFNAGVQLEAAQNMRPDLVAIGERMRMVSASEMGDILQGEILRITSSKLPPADQIHAIRELTNVYQKNIKKI